MYVQGELSQWTLRGQSPSSVGSERWQKVTPWVLGSVSVLFITEPQGSRRSPRALVGLRGGSVEYGGETAQVTASRLLDKASSRDPATRKAAWEGACLGTAGAVEG